MANTCEQCMCSRCDNDKCPAPCKAAMACMSAVVGCKDYKEKTDV